MLSINQLLGDPTDFLSKIIHLLQQKGIEVSNYELDHICYRVATKERYEYLSNQLMQLGILLVESNINGRLIATFKLNQPICFQNQNIHCIELPAPKIGSFYKEGYEHVEFVIDQPFETFIKKHPMVYFDKKGMNKKLNADLRVKLETYSVKFHHQSLEKVIELEKKLLS